MTPGKDVLSLPDRTLLELDVEVPRTHDDIREGSRFTHPSRTAWSGTFPSSFTSTVATLASTVIPRRTQGQVVAVREDRAGVVREYESWLDDHPARDEEQ